jgi:hypothetical protein
MPYFLVERRRIEPRDRCKATGLQVSVPKTPSIGFANPGESEHDCWMFAIAGVSVAAAITFGFLK